MFAEAAGQIQHDQCQDQNVGGEWIESDGC